MIVNYVDLVLILLTALIIFVSTRRGILISLVSMLRVFLGVPLAFFVSGKYNELIYDSFVRTAVITALQNKMKEKSGLEELLSNIRDTAESLPEIISQNLDLFALSRLSVKNAAEYIEHNVARPIGLLAVEITLFLAVFIVIMIVTGIIIHLLKIRNKKDKTPLRKTDMLFGGIFGALKSAVIVIALSALSAMLLDIVPKDYAANDFVTQLEGSRIIGFVNQFIKL